MRNLKKSILTYTLVTVGIFSGAWGLADSGYFTAGEAIARGIAFFVFFNLFLVFRMAFRALRKAILKRELKSQKYQETDLDE